jgi:two-component system sensor histidine kinase BaeS
MTWREHHRRYRRYRRGAPPGIQRIGCAVAALVLFTAIGTTSVVSFVARSQLRGWVVLAGIAMTFLIVAGFASTFRRMARVFGEQVRLRRQLMADVAHELRTPLSILQGRIEGMLDGVYPPDKARLGELLTETQHLSRLIEDVRTLANAEAGALELRKEPVDVTELIRDAAAAMGPGIQVDVPDELRAEADPVRIREVLLNLLSNAVRHAQAVSVSAEASSREIVIRVRDNGSGIPAGELPHVFERFHKSRDSRGSGLGLSIARKLVLAHEGTIGVESEVGVGTTVTVRLPR